MTRGLVIAVTVTACALAVGVPAARAGTIWVTDGNMNAGQTGSCNAFGLYGDLPAFTAWQNCLGGQGMFATAGGPVPAGQNVYWMTTAPPGITINSAWTSNPDVTATGIDDGWTVGDFWLDESTDAYAGSTLASGRQWFNTSLEASSNINSQVYGIQLLCTHTASQGPCPGLSDPSLTVGGVELAGTENTGPNLAGFGSLWYEPSGAEIWNPPGDPWQAELYATDFSGICSMYALVGDHELQGPQEPRDDTAWQQCPDPVSWSSSVDTRSYVPTSGPLSMHLYAVNAAGVLSSLPNEWQVDNDPVGVSLSTPNDPDPSVWVNHAVTVDARATAGPSGVGGMNCSTDGSSPRAYPAGGVTLASDGVHTVTCTAWNNAVDPQGQPNTGTNSITVHIDEAPPSLSFAPQDPSNPTKLTVDTGDAESGIAGGSIEMAPVGTSNWTTLPTSFDGSHLTAQFDDAGLTGAYTFRATSCDNVGNCASTSEPLALPLRVASASDVSLQTIANPLRRVVVVERVKRAGHVKKIKVVKYVERCTTKRVQTGPHRWRRKRICASPSVHVTSSLRVPYGDPVTIHGLYVTAQGVPMAHQPVRVFAAPDNQSDAFSWVSTVITAPDGSWSATLPPGPSQIIRAVTDGTATILPSSGQVTTIVPARVRLVRVWPRHVAWGGTVHLVGQLVGGYLPAGGALVRLRIGYGKTYETYGVEEHVTGTGRFSTVASFGPGDPSDFRTYWFQIASLPMGNYPYAPAASQRVPVIVGGHPQDRLGDHPQNRRFTDRSRPDERSR